ncbi:Oidioi.mRNA.OKI2018_I69.XSR.g15993.t1.cds [Oikopleura dioica]|uniref:Oidioi.mRNA.OKI2018_I69.XSR.g15993.t1.cds n=1 Tax=Oikopleura dioica TaxID=34765 RepID=A0ABN7SF57_OIKDI|nr:Oidioi.mRNA.OKI2018_I69.XSR.g15993.t1.cds [Oikopleura dioica]
MLLFHFLAILLVKQLEAKNKRYIKCKACSKTENAGPFFTDFESEEDVEKTAADVDTSCDKPENSKSIKCDKTAGCLMIKDKQNNIFNFGCVKKWNQEKKKGEPIEKSGYNPNTIKALENFDRCEPKNKKSGGCKMPGFESFDVSNLLTSSIPSERDKFVNNLFECGANFCYICDNGDDCNYSEDIRDANFEKWYKDKQESEKVTTTTKAEITETTTTLATDISDKNSTAPVPFASLTIISIALIHFFLP